MIVKCRDHFAPAVHLPAVPLTREALQYVRHRTEEGYTEVELARILGWTVGELRGRAERHGYPLRKADTSA